MRTPLLAGNWKMYKTIGEAQELVKALLKDLGDVNDREVAICPTYTALASVKPMLDGTPIKLGAQDVFHELEGAYTGAISPLMLTDIGCTYAIVGHSERRQYFHEDDVTINRKLRAALANGLRPILCVGETKPQRDAGHAEAIVMSQIKADLDNVSAEEMKAVVIAYEPVWAIGTGDTATPDDAQAMHHAIRQTLAGLYDEAIAGATRIQYGGSVKPNNVDELMAQPDIDGALVGGASLKAQDFLRIVHFQ
jgi:triosephosphate isomerase